MTSLSCPLFSADFANEPGLRGALGDGAFDLVAEIEVADLAEFDEVLSKVRQIEGIERSETSLLLAPA